MFGLFLKTAKPRHVAYGAVALIVAAGAAHWAGLFPEAKDDEDILTASVTPTIAVSRPVAVPVPVPRPDIAELPKLAPVPKPSPIAGAKREFVKFDSRDMGGGDYAVLDRVSRSVCETRCLLDRQCVAFTFNKWEGTCFLKSSLSELRLEPRATSGVLASAKVTKDGRPPIIQKVPSRRLEGDNYRQLQAGFSGCAEACLADDRCTGFNLRAEGQSCSLMAFVDKSVRTPGSTTGLKMQLGRKMGAPERRRHPWPPAGMPPEMAELFDAMISQAMR